MAKKRMKTVKQANKETMAMRRGLETTMRERIAAGKPVPKPRAGTATASILKRARKKEGSVRSAVRRRKESLNY